MQMFKRATHNHALNFAIAHKRKLPLVVYESLKFYYPWANDRPWMNRPIFRQNVLYDFGKHGQKIRFQEIYRMDETAKLKKLVLICDFSKSCCLCRLNCLLHRRNSDLFSTSHFEKFFQPEWLILEMTYQYQPIGKLLKY